MQLVFGLWNHGVEQYLIHASDIWEKIPGKELETLNAFDIFIGVNAIDYSGYPDCRPKFISKFEQLMNLATKDAVQNVGTYKIHTPLIKLTKSEIIEEGIELGVNYEITSSCYSPNKYGSPCGCCDACNLRLKGFHDAGLVDPLEYR